MHAVILAFFLCLYSQLSPSKQKAFMFGARNESKALRRSFRKKNLSRTGLSMQLAESGDCIMPEMAMESGSLLVEEDEERLSDSRPFAEVRMT